MLASSDPDAPTVPASEPPVANSPVVPATVAPRAADRVVSLRWRDVEAVVPGATTAEEFRTRRAAVKDSDAAGLYALGLWARRAGLPDEGRKSFDAALAADPQHAGARDALTQQRSDGKWLAVESLLAAKGFVARDGAWVLREEAESLERRAATAKGMTDDEKKVETTMPDDDTYDTDAREAAEHQHEQELLAQDPAYADWLDTLDSQTDRR